MYMNLKSNRRKRISFKTLTMASLGFIGPLQNLRSPLKFSSPPPPNLIFCSGPLQLFWSEIFRSPPKIRGWAAIMKKEPGTSFQSPALSQITC